METLRTKVMNFSNLGRGVNIYHGRKGIGDFDGLRRGSYTPLTHMVCRVVCLGAIDVLMGGKRASKDGLLLRGTSELVAKS